MNADGSSATAVNIALLPLVVVLLETRRPSVSPLLAGSALVSLSLSPPSAPFPLFLSPLCVLIVLSVNGLVLIHASCQTRPHPPGDELATLIHGSASALQSMRALAIQLSNPNDGSATSHPHRGPRPGSGPMAFRSRSKGQGNKQPSGSATKEAQRQDPTAVRRRMT